GEDDRDDLAGRGRSVGAKWWRWAGLDDERAATSAAEPEARWVLGAAARASRHEAVPAAPAELHAGRVVEAAGSAGHGPSSTRAPSPTSQSSIAGTLVLGRAARQGRPRMRRTPPEPGQAGFRAGRRRINRVHRCV